MTHRTDLGRRSRWTYCITVVALILAAVLAVRANVPVPLRILCLPVLVVIPGAAALTLILGVEGRTTDRMLRIPLSVLLGFLVCLFVTLTLHVAGIRIDAASLAVGVGIVAAVLVIAAVWLRGAAAPALTVAPREIVAVLGSAGVLVAAVIGAQALQPHHVEYYTSLSFDDSRPFAGEPYVAAPNAPVRLDWVVRSFGYRMSAGPTGVQVWVDGSVVNQTAVDLYPVLGADISGATGTMGGAVTFTAPAEPGRYPVRLEVSPVSANGVELPQPGTLTTFVEVKE